jgi:outer membrane protein assembly factor BamB
MPLTTGRGEDWPTYRHDRLRTAVTSEKLKLPLAKSWTFRSRQSADAPKPTQPPHMVGFPECSQFVLPMIAAGGAVFFSDAQDGRVVCLDAATGKTRWQFVASAAVNRTPMFWQGKIYAASDDGHVYCLDAASGKLVWKFQAAPTDRQFLAYGKMVSVWPVRTDVLVDKGVAYFAAGLFPHEGTFLYGIDANTGKLLWRNGTQAENGGQLSLAPGGHLYVTGRDIWVPKDFRGYSHPYYGSPTPFLRADGRFVNGFGSSKEDDPERPKIEGGVWHKSFLSLLGVVKDGVRYIGASAWKVEGEEKKREILWQHATPDRWVDADSGIGVRMKGTPVIFRYDPDLSTLVFAGDTLFHSAFDQDPKKGVGSGIYARDPKTGKILWSVEIPERANQLMVAGGRLFVGTRRGTIYSFAAAGTPVIADRVEKTEAVAATDDTGQQWAAAVKTIIAQTGVKEGYAVVLDCNSGQLAAELAQRTKLNVIAVFSDPAAAAKAREAYCRANLHLTRIVTWTAPPDAVLPYSSFFADLIVSESAVLGGDLPANVAELMRLQKPIRGIALIGGKQSPEALKKWTTATKQKDWQAIDSAGSWAKRTRPRLVDGGAWTHMFGDAGNTGCSHDGVLKPPLGVAWYGAPQIQQPGGHTALIIDGILVVPQPNALEACDQYTGRRLWRLDAGSVGVSIAASGKHVYTKIAHVLAQLDLLTGKEVASYLTAFGKEHPWGWYAVSEDGKTVYGAAGGGLFATEMESGKGNIRWAIGGPKAKDADKIGGMIAMNNGRIFILGGAASDAQRAVAIAQMREWMKTQSKAMREEYEKQIKDRDIRELIAVDAASGKIVFRRGVDVSNCGGKWMRPTGFGSKRHYNPHVMMGMYAHNGVVVIASESKADKGWQVWNSGGYQVRGCTAIDGQSGKLLWYKFTNHRTRPVIIDDTLHAEPWAFDLRTGKKKTRLHPITGEEADWAWCRSDKQCGIFSASKHFLFGRNKGFGYKDLLNDEGLYTFWHSRSNCFVDHVSGGGLMIKPPQAIYCKCEWSLPFTVAMGQVTNLPAAAPMFAQPGRTLPVKHLRLDFGASGDRRDADGRLWLTANRPVNHKLLLSYDVQTILHEGGSDVRRSARFTDVENANPPFVFASALVGLKRCVLPVVRPEDGTGTFRVRLGFAAMPGDKPGQRVFDVRINGRTVLEGFDVVAEAGGQNRAVWKEFTVDVERDLVLDLLPKTATSDPARLPVLNALEIVREKINTLGMTQPEDVWLNNTTSEKPLELHLANLRSEAFRGKLQLELPAGVEIVGLPKGGAIALEPEGRKQLDLQIKAGEKTPRGKHAIVAKLVGQDGRVLMQRRWHVEWLGPLERRVLRGGSAPVRQERLNQLWSRTVRPNRHWEILQVSQGYQKPLDGGAATAYIWFHVPKELRDKKIQQARIRLHTHASASQLLNAAGPLPSASPKPGGPKATLRRLVGPPWPKFNEVKYPNLPKPIGESIALTPVAGQAGQFESKLPGAIEASDEKPDVYLAIEPTQPRGAVFWSHAAPDSSQAPVLIIDFLPTK